ncbi:MAG: alpha/beta hydrolase family protein [Planctomycetota bacterium]|jgi:putative tributyrin esterase|nr:alpha/beta hydrolase family protein [Planctomycetota bacterium]
MACLEMHYSSAALSKQSGLYVVTPDAWDGAPLPVLYLLHGLSDDFSSWFRRSAIERHAQAHRMLVVMPDGGRGWYTNAVQPPSNRFEDHILEVVHRIDGLFNTVADRSGRGIGGLSMGGYGAVKLGLKHPELFGSIHSHSGALDVSRMESHWTDEKSLIHGDTVPNSEDPMWLAAQVSPRPAVHIDCGVDDFLIEDNRRFHAHLEAIGYPHTYLEPAGDHSWPYWDANIVAALAFHAEHFAAL